MDRPPNHVVIWGLNWGGRAPNKFGANHIVICIREVGATSFPLKDELLSLKRKGGVLLTPARRGWGLPSGTESWATGRVIILVLLKIK